VAYFIEALIAGRDGKQFRITCYAKVDHPDDLSERIRAAADAWRDIRCLDDQAVAELVRKRLHHFCFVQPVPPVSESGQ
jgi:predicted O-linked N-acetylglucosamine transferase (SPINDLY family)